jgi:hypothetical protein
MVGLASIKTSFMVCLKSLVIGGLLNMPLIGLIIGDRNPIYREHLVWENLWLFLSLITFIFAVVLVYFIMGELEKSR